MEISVEEIGKRIKKMRKESGYTQEQLAEYAEVSVDFISAVETGKSGIGVQKLAKIAKVLNVTSDYLIYGNEPYKENLKINMLLSVVPESRRKQVEKLIILFLDSLRSEEDDSKED